MGKDVYEPPASDQGAQMERGSKARVPLLWKILVALLIVIIIVMMIALIVQGKKLSDKDCKSNCPKAGSSSSKRKSQDDLELPEDAGVFQDLSAKEYRIVRDFMLGQKSLSLTKYEDAKLTDNFIVLIEMLMPPKAEALRHLNEGGKKPTRRARVVVSEGQYNPPVVREYVVEGLPKPNKYKELRLSGVKSPIPFEKRLFTKAEGENFHVAAGEAARQAYVILKESFGYWFANCTDHCLTMFFNGVPGSSKVGERKYWVSFLRRVAGSYLQPVPFQLRVDVTSKDTTKWKVDQVMYNKQRFASLPELVTKYRAGSIKKIKIPVLTPEQEMRSTFRVRPSSSDQPSIAGPTFVEPEGKRFVIKGRKVTYKDWTFHIVMRASGGLALFDVRFRNETIAYELSVQEGISYYSGNAPQAASSYYLDSAWGLGWSTFGASKGVDCPATSTLLDVHHYVGVGEPLKLANAICVFELNTGQASRRHVEFKTSKDGKKVEGLWFAGGLLDRAIVVRTVSTPSNYDYTFDYILHENGVIEARTAASGYAYHTPYNQDEDPYGFKTTTDALGLIHDHFILHKVDLDIAGTENSFQTLDVKTKSKAFEWEPGTTRVYKTIEKSIKEREKDATVKYNFDKPKYYTMINELKRNKFGSPRGYRIVPNSMVKQVFPNSFFPVPAVAWSEYQIAVTKRKDAEPFGSSIFNQFGMEDPAFNFASMIKDDELIRGQDLVAWINTGCLHIPSTEDIPLTTTSGSIISFVLKPYGYFNEDPSMTSKEGFYYENKYLP